MLCRFLLATGECRKFSIGYWHGILKNGGMGGGLVLGGGCDIYKLAGASLVLGTISPVGLIPENRGFYPLLYSNRKVQPSE